MSEQHEHGSVADEIAALIEALRARTPGAAASGAASDSGERRDDGEKAADACECGQTHSRLDACQICPVCRALGALHTVSPATVGALADLAHQAEVTLRALAADLQRRNEPPGPTSRTDIRVEDLDV
ncbi:MAG: hypothetical protein Q4G67_00985 [Actinomycetia bacterium]|nr:hypothetical protein [Actinomycetes bacterium]